MGRQSEVDAQPGLDLTHTGALVPRNQELLHPYERLLGYVGQ